MKDNNVKRMFREKLMLNGGQDSVEAVWQNMKNGLLKTVDESCGWTKGRPRHRETWWWNSDVKEKVDEKKLKYKTWYNARGTPSEQAA